jgi:chaperonin cofactor prefoldin
MDRDALIARKYEVRRRLERAQSALAELQKNAADPKGDRRRIAQLQSEIERLMAEEYNLRLAIDQSRPNR